MCMCFILMTGEHLEMCDQDSDSQFPGLARYVFMFTFNCVSKSTSREDICYHLRMTVLASSSLI